MKRRLFLLAVLPVPAMAGLFSEHRTHTLARLHCDQGGILSLTLRGEPWRLTVEEEKLCNEVEREMHALSGH